MRERERGEIVWVQELRNAAGARPPAWGFFVATTACAIVRFQLRHQLPASGALDAATWRALLRYTRAGARGSALGSAAAPAGLAPGADRGHAASGSARSAGSRRDLMVRSVVCASPSGCPPSLGSGFRKPALSSARRTFPAGFLRSLFVTQG